MKAIVSPTLEIQKEIENLLLKQNIKWTSLKIYETSDGFLVEIESPDVKNNLEGIELSDKLEKQLKYLDVSIAILPSN